MKFDRYFLALKALLNAKYVFHEPEKEDLLIFDGESLNQLKYILPSFKYQVIETRINRIKEIYITPKIFFSTIRNIKTNILNSYLLTLVDIIKPKVVFTFIDNSEKFSEFAALRKKKYKFVALQNGARYEHRTYKELFKKKIISKGYVKFNIPYFLCFGENEVEEYKKLNQKINNFFKVGSLKLANFLFAQKEKKILKPKKKNDILLISDIYCWDEILSKLNLPMEGSQVKLIKFTIKFAIKNNLKIKLATRNSKNSFRDEKNFYKKYLNKEEYQYVVKNLFFRKGYYDTYSEMQKSEVVIGTMSTLLRENLFIGGKSLSCNFTNSSIFDFPISGLCSLKDVEFIKFEKRIKEILKISHKTYLSKIKKDPSFVVFKDAKYSTIKLVKSKLNFFLN